MEEGVSVAAPRGDMDGSRIRVTDISESCKGQKVFLRWTPGPGGGWGWPAFYFLICVPSVPLFPAPGAPFFVSLASS